MATATLGFIGAIVLVIILGFVVTTIKSKLLAALAFLLIWIMGMAIPGPVGTAFQVPCDVTICGWYQDNQAALEQSSSR